MVLIRAAVAILRTHTGLQGMILLWSSTTTTDQSYTARRTLRHSQPLYTLMVLIQAAVTIQRVHIRPRGMILHRASTTMTKRSHTTPQTLPYGQSLYLLVILLIQVAITILRTSTSLGCIRCRAFGFCDRRTKFHNPQNAYQTYVLLFIFSYSLLEFLVLDLISGFEALVFCSLSFHLYISDSSPSQGAILALFSRFRRSEVWAISRVVLLPPLPHLSDSRRGVDIFSNLGSADIYYRVDRSLIPRTRDLLASH